MSPAIRAVDARRAELVLALAIAVSYLLVWPVGNYVIEDDWIFTRSLLHFHEAGALRILDWNPMTLVAHVFWGALFTKVFGFSFTVAKISTVVLLWLAGAATIALLRRVGASEATATVGALALLFNPLCFFEGFLYATDVPAVAWSTVALALYARGLTAGSRPSLWLGSLAASMAWGVRQPGILVVAALFVYLALFDRPRLASADTWLSCFSLPALAVAAFTVWYRFVHGPTEAYLVSQRAIVMKWSQTTLASTVENAYVLIAYLAFFLLPLALATPLAAYRPGRRRWLAAGLGAFLAWSFVWVTFGRNERFPYLLNKITRYGYLRPNELLLGNRDVLWGGGVAWAITLLLALAALALVLRLCRDAGDEPSRRPAGERATRRLVGVLLVVQLLYVGATLGIVFDRHLLILLPAAIVLFAGAPSRLSPRPWIVAACLVPLAFYSVAGTHDIHALSRAAFQAGIVLMDRGIDPRDIDAGVAFDGWFMYERSRREVAEGQPKLGRSGDMWYLRSGLISRISTRYVVALAPASARGSPPWPDRYRIVGEREYRNWWPYEKKKLVILEDVTLDGPDVGSDGDP